ncbi:MAG TPA: serine/threonine-protein kinase [Woeseiaceae bacterium]|nr:serine/threonine-protein kinase [Woeseiaceae bacterium]
MGAGGRPCDWDRARALFERAIELPEGDRAAFLERECATDADMRREVESLLRADGAAGGLLDDPSAALGTLLDEPLEEERPEGWQIGAWRILRELGRGGMGIVYLVERADRAWEQQAALKLVRGGLFGGALEQRFLRERNILARLEHPGIARLLDGGITPEGQPYLVMERVEGMPVTDWAKAHGLNVRARLRLFLEICDAVEYAHRRLVVHRDLKPANILVTAEGRVRLLDFGVARLLDDASDEAGLTRTGMLLLTPEYAAPEQVLGHPPTTATDVFGLGAVLYELLSGRAIRRIGSTAIAEVLRAVQADILPLTSNPAMSPALRRRLSGDLETIVHCALAAEPERRYATVGMLADDIRHHLENRPVRARPAGLRYRAGKYLRRHRAGVTAAAAGALLLALGIGGTLWQAEEARREGLRAQEMSAFLQDLFESVDPFEARGHEVTARELLDKGARRIDSLRADPEVRVDVLRTLGDLYYKLGVFDRSEELLRRAEHEAVQAFGARHERTVNARNSLGYLLVDMARHDEAEDIIELALAAARRLRDPVPLTYSLDALAHLYGRQGRHAEARDLRAELLELNTRLHGAESWQVAASLNGLGAAELDLDNFEEAERLLQQAATLERKLLPPAHPSLANTLGLLAAVELNLGRPERAEPLQREELAIRIAAFGEEHPDVALSYDQLGITLTRLNRLDEAARLYDRTLELRRRTLGERHTQVADTLTNITALIYQMGDLETAIARQEEALGIYRESFGETHPRVLNAMSNLGFLLTELGRYDEAGEVLERTLALRREALGEEHIDVGTSLQHLGNLYRMTGRLGESESALRRALAIYEARLPDAHSSIARTRAGLGATLVVSGRAAEALPLLEAAEPNLGGRYGDEDPRVAECRLWLGVALAAVGRDGEARPKLESAQAALAARHGPDHGLTRRAVAELDSLERRLASAE